MWLAAIAAALALAAAPVDADDPFADCRAQVQADPREIEAYRCFLMIGRRSGRLAEAAGELERLRGQAPGEPRVLLFLAAVRHDLGDPAALDLIQQAIEGFVREGHPAGEVRARLFFVFLLGPASDLEQRRSELDAAGRAAERGDAMLAARVAVGRAWLTVQQGDHGRAWALFRRAAEEALPDGPYDLRDAIVNGLGWVCWASGRYREAYDWYRLQAEMAVAEGDRVLEASGRYNVALLAAQLVPSPSRLERHALLAEALLAAQRAANRSTEAAVRLLLGQELFDQPQGREQLEAARAIARRIGDVDTELYALRHLALFDAGEREHGRAAARLEEALQRSRRSGLRHHVIGSLAVASELADQRGDLQGAREEILAALDEVERLRAQQGTALERARVLDRYAFLVQRAVRLFLDDPRGQPPPDALDAAIGLIDRFRGRSLLDRLAPRGAERVPDDELPRQVAALAAAMAAVQRELLDPGLPEPAREAALEELDRLEARSLELESLRPLPVARPEPVTADRIQSALAMDEALLLLQVAPWRTRRWSEGGSFGIVVTRGQAVVVRLPDPETLATRVRLLHGLIERRDERAEGLASSLAGEWLAPLVDQLPPGMTRLVVLPDGPIHDLPIAALVAAGEPRVVSVVPSLGFFLRQRSGDVGVLAGRRVAVGAPLTPSAPSTDAATRAWSLVSSSRLGALPYARAELEAAANGGTLLVGGEATEGALKQIEGGVAVLHLATHALVDDEMPQRSAILLSPSDGEDGLLQGDEIAALPLAGSLVVLAACRSADGQLLQGEGLVGLASSFLAAGARVVVGNLWPAGDRESARFFGLFYPALGQGATVAEAVQVAQRQRRAAGAPLAEWAGVVTLGDGSARLERGPARSGPGSPGLAAVALAVGVLAASGAVRRRRIGVRGARD